MVGPVRRFGVGGALFAPIVQGAWPLKLSYALGAAHVVAHGPLDSLFASEWPFICMSLTYVRTCVRTGLLSVVPSLRVVLWRSRACVHTYVRTFLFGRGFVALHAVVLTSFSRTFVGGQGGQVLGGGLSIAISLLMACLARLGRLGAARGTPGLLQWWPALRWRV